MRPMEHKKKENIELIEHIQETLSNYSEAYKPGAWENFKKREVKPAGLELPIWRWASVAAAVVVCLSVFLLLSKKTVEKSVSTVSNAVAKSAADPSPINSPAPTLKKLSAEKLTITSEINVDKEEEILLASEAPLTEKSQAAAVVEQSLNEAVAQVVPEEKVEIKPESVQKAVLDESKMDPISKPKRLKVFNNNRWALGFMIAPSLSQNANDLNLGYGLSVSYTLSKKLSINSGLAFNKMNASKNLPTNLGASSIVISNNKKLAVISEEVSGIDIPIELKYQFSPKIYANFGLSGFAVINQQRSNTFIQDVVVNRPNTSLPNGSGSPVLGGPSPINLSDPSGPQGQFANAFIMRQRVTERVSSQALDNINFLGFYNFSIGYTHRIYKQNTIAIEPFFKLPVREVTQDNLRMVGTGVRIKVGF